ncbi:MAG: hypothetical protein ACXABJ_02845 [Candidatus Heimdallarchaeaceae archaeon]|jgi:hypothetical protein
MSEEEEQEKKRLPDDVTKELLQKAEDTMSDVSEVAEKLEGKIPTKPKEEEE